MKPFSFLNRAADVQRLGSQEFDLLVIGGGITGAGIVLDAQVRGLSTALVEMQDFSAGTSSRSTKLVHGGLRYLKQLEFRLVAEVGSERAIVHSNALHITKPEPMLLPIVKGGSMGKLAVRAGMWIYETLAQVKKSEWHKMLGKEEILAKEPLLGKENVLGGVLFYEYRTDDSRLTLEVLKEAVAKGCTALNYTRATGFLYTSGGQLCGARVHDEISGESYEIRARSIVNATGPWTDDVCRTDNPAESGKLHITKGVHIVVDAKKLPVRESVYFDTPDKRMVFAIPRQGKVYIGTTDTFYEGDIRHPSITPEDCRYLVAAVRAMFPSATLSVQDIESGWAGIRPLVQKPGKGPSEISRKDEIFFSPAGLITIAGGKLTGYRKMAERTVNLVAKKLKKQDGRTIPACSTDKVQLSGGKLEEAGFNDFLDKNTARGQELGFSRDEALELTWRYGSNIDKIFRIAVEQSSSGNRLPLFILAQLIYGIEEEMVIKPSDFFIRRTGALLFDIEQVRQWKDTVAEYLAAYFGWDTGMLDSCKAELDSLLLEVSRLRNS